MSSHNALHNVLNSHFLAAIIGTGYQEKARLEKEKAEEQARAERALRRASPRRVKQQGREQQTHRGAPASSPSSPPSLSSPPARSAAPDSVEKAPSLPKQESADLKSERSDEVGDAEETSRVDNEEATSSAGQADGAGDNAMDLLAAWAVLGLKPPSETASTLATSSLEMAAVAAAAAEAAVAAENTKDDDDGAAIMSDVGRSSSSGGGTNKDDHESGRPLIPAGSTETVRHARVLSNATADDPRTSVCDPDHRHEQAAQPMVASSA